MTEYQSEQLNEFINTIEEKQLNCILEETVYSVSLYFGELFFANYINQIYNDYLKEGKTKQDIVNAVKLMSDDKDVIYSKIVYVLQDNKKAEEFIEECLESKFFKPEYDQILLNKLHTLEIPLKDFCASFIFSIKEQLIDFLVTYQIEDWKKYVIDGLVNNWDLLNQE